MLARLPAACERAGGQRFAQSLGSREALATVVDGAGLAQPARETLLGWRVDFRAGESVVLVHAGMQPNPGWTLGVPQDPVRQGERLVLSARLDPPPRGAMVVQMIAHPCLFLHLAGPGYRQVDLRWIERR